MADRTIHTRQFIVTLHLPAVTYTVYRCTRRGEEESVVAGSQSPAASKIHKFEAQRKMDERRVTCYPRLCGANMERERETSRLAERRQWKAGREEEGRTRWKCKDGPAGAQLGQQAKSVFRPNKNRGNRSFPRRRDREKQREMGHRLETTSRDVSSCPTTSRRFEDYSLLWYARSCNRLQKLWEFAQSCNECFNAAKVASACQTGYRVKRRKGTVQWMSEKVEGNGPSSLWSLRKFPSLAREKFDECQWSFRRSAIVSDSSSICGEKVERRYRRP